MGVVAIGLRVMNEESGAEENIGLLLDKAYLPAAGQASTCIISTGRLFEKQGIEIFLNGDNRLVMGRYSHRFNNVNFSPSAYAVLAQGPPRSLHAKTVRVHLTGVPKHTTLRAGHLRLGHASFELTALAFGLPLTRTVKCSCCLEFKARGPSASSTPAKKLAATVGERVSIDAWSYAKYPAATTGWIAILGAIDEAFDLFDAIGCAEPTGKIAGQFLRLLMQLYRSEYKAPISTVRVDNGTIFDCAEFKDTAAELKIALEWSAPYLHFQLRIERHWQTMKRDGACMVATARLSKHFFIHACLHAAMIRTVIRRTPDAALGDDCDRTKSAYEVVTGKVYPLEALRIFGAHAWGTMLPEQRQQLRLDTLHSVMDCFNV